MPKDLTNFLQFLKIDNLDDFRLSNVLKVKVYKKENRIDIDLENPRPFLIVLYIN